MHLSVDLRQNYFVVFDALAPKLGMMTPANAAKVVSFYAYCKAVIDSLPSDGRFITNASPDDIRANLVEVERILTAVLLLGDAIAQSPKVSLAEDE